MIPTRNAAMLAALCIGAVLINGRTTTGGATDAAGGPERSLAATRGRRGLARRGFTLIEILLVCAIIAIVVSLIMPSLASMRARAQNLKSMANLRAHTTTMAVYTVDSSDYFPYLTDPRATLTVLRGGGETVAVPYFMLFTTWNVGLADEYYGGNARHDSMILPWGATPWPYILYFYGDVFISSPDYWRYETRKVDGSQLVPTRATDVLFPSMKGLMYEMGWHGNLTPSRDPGRSNVRFSLVDGSVREYRDSDLNPTFVFGSQPPGQNPPTGWSYGLPVMATIDGVRGRDVK